MIDRFDIDLIAEGVNSAWQAYSIALMIALPVVAAGVLWLLLWWIRRSIRVLARIPDIKMHVGFAVVQAGVAVAVVTGVYEAATRLFQADLLHGLVIALFAEAVVWVAIGRIRAYTRDNPNKGVGLAGRVFWIASIGGGLFAALGSSNLATAAGRVIIVVFGTALWWERIREWAPATGSRSRWRWTPSRIGMALGLIEPDDADLDQGSHEWQIRRVARAMWWANGCWPWSWIGGRMLASRATTTTPDVLAAARRRFADAWVLRQQARVDSDVMSAVVVEAEQAAKWTAGQQVDIHRTPTPDTGGTSAAAIGWTPVDTDGGHRRDSGVDKSPARVRVSGRAARRGHGSKVSDDGLSKRQRRVLDLLAQDDPRLTQADIAKKLGVTSKTVQRALTDMRRAMGAKSNDELRDIVTGQGTHGEVDRWPDTAGDAGPDMAAASSGQTSNGRADIDPSTVADMAAANDRT